MTHHYIVPPCTRPVNILHRDQDLLLIEKPDLLLSIPGRDPRNSDCVISRIRKTDPEASMVHRLDLDTSGVMVIPLHRQCHAHISRQFQQRNVVKHYEAWVYGTPQQDEGTIDLAIAPDWSNRPRQKICSERGKSALTHYEVVQRDSSRNVSKLLLKPVTGRSHQLRIHLSAIGHPILGCDLYAHAKALAMAPRLLLHATYLAFTHPGTGNTLSGRSLAEF